MHKKKYKEYNAQIRQKCWKYSNEMIDITIEKIIFLCHFFVHPPSHLSKKVKVVSSIQLSLKCEILQKKSVSKNVIRNTLVRSQMRLLKNVFKGNPVYFCWFYTEKALYSDVAHANEHKKSWLWLACRLLEFFGNTILISDEKGLL